MWIRTSGSSICNITTLLHELHCIPVFVYMQFKMLVITQPDYLQDQLSLKVSVHSNKVRQHGHAADPFPWMLLFSGIYEACLFHRNSASYLWPHPLGILVGCRFLVLWMVTRDEFPPNTGIGCDLSLKMMALTALEENGWGTRVLLLAYCFWWYSNYWIIELPRVLFFKNS